MYEARLNEALARDEAALAWTARTIPPLRVAGDLCVTCDGGRRPCTGWCASLHLS